MKDYLKRICQEKKNIVLIGEAGSGKTEVSINMATLLTKVSRKTIHMFDMDQTKPIFRARDSAGSMESEGVIFHYQKQYMDAPIVASGVIEKLRDPESIVLLDIGGGAYGSHMIGQFASYLNSPDTKVLFLINPYRPWSGSLDNIEETIRRTVGAAHLNEISIAANPNLGLETTAEDVISGLNMLRRILPGMNIEFLCVRKELAAAVAKSCDLPVLPVTLNTPPEWLG